MAFYRPDKGMVSILEALIESLEHDGRPGLGDQLSITWLRYEDSLIGRGADLEPAAFWGLPVAGASWGGSHQRYPASVVKLVYMVAVEAWLQQQWLEEGPELRRAMADMIRDSSNDATGLVVDLLSGTTSGPDLSAPRLAAWSAQRQLVNGWLADLSWPEFEGCNACQKTWGDGPFGRERQSYGEALENRNRLSSDATARLLHGVIAGALVSPPASARMRDLLARSLEPAALRADPENQVVGFLGEGLGASSRLWSKAGWMSQARHDAAYVEVEGQAPFLLVVFSEGADRAADGALLPSIARALRQVGAG